MYVQVATGASLSFVARQGKARPVALPNTRRGFVSFPAAVGNRGRRQTIAVLEMRMRFFDALCYTGTWFHVRRAEVYKHFFLFIALWPLKKFSSLVWFVDPLFTSGLPSKRKVSNPVLPGCLLFKNVRERKANILWPIVPFLTLPSFPSALK